MWWITQQNLTFSFLEFSYQVRKIFYKSQIQKNFFIVIYREKMKDHQKWLILNMVFMAFILTTFCLPWNKKGDPLFFPESISASTVLIIKQMVMHSFVLTLVFSSYKMMLAISMRGWKITWKFNAIRILLLDLTSCTISILEDLFFKVTSKTKWMLIVSVSVSQC